MRRLPGSLCLFALGAVLGLGGCSRGCRGDRPYVPYSIEDGPAPASSEADAGSTEELGALPDAGAFLATAAELAPPDAVTFAPGGVEVQAPEGTVFVAGLGLDVDGDGARDVAAWVRKSALGGDSKAPPPGPRRGPPDVGSLLFYKGKPGGGVDAPVGVFPAPSLGGDGTCTPAIRLAQVGPRSLFVEARVECPGGAPPGPRWIAVASLAAPARLRFSATVTDPPGAPTLTFEADGSDFDHDGVDDVTLRITAEGASAPFEPGPKVSAILRWLDRPAGMSRDGAEPDASLKSVAAQALVRATKPKDAPFVPILVQELRFLWGALCAEGGAPRFGNVLGGDTMACGPSRALEEAGLAETRAFATMGDAVRAFAALDRAQKPPATSSPGRTKEAFAWLEKIAPSSTARSVRLVAAVPAVEKGRAPTFGPLAFEASGKLLVRTAAGVARVDPSLGDEASADDVPPWRTAVVSPDGEQRLIEAYNPCNGPAVRLTFAPTGEAEMQDVALPVPVPLGARCARAKGEAVPTVPFAWGPRGLELLVAGDPVLVPPGYARATLLQGFLDQPVSLGAPRSPNGRFFVVPTAHGLLVRGPKARLYKAKEWEQAYGELRSCVVSDDGASVACVRGNRVTVGAWDAP